MRNLTDIQRDLLSALGGVEELHDRALENELEDNYRTEAHQGQLAPHLEALVNEGLIEKRENDQRTKRYTLTCRGRRELQANREWGGHSIDEDPEADG